MKRKKISFMLTSAPCSTKNVTIFSDFALMAIKRGQSLIVRVFHDTMINMKRKRMLYNNDKYETNVNSVKQ